ncbi:unnamed protein product [Calicophoron daubneyi]|uniref:ditrans,polycis-polyprenyl diphosphate synthase [(2E,6E)-farnesyldiphosphate specific] n=1 Tax=Calicophoron daubneyi TaxID=300641 RepID=A0AAV2TLT9_CALDB
MDVYGLLLRLIIFMQQLIYLFTDLIQLVLLKIKLVADLLSIRIHPKSAQDIKIPSHISFNIYENEISLDKIVNVLLWSHEIGIPVASISDVKGNLFKLRQNFENKLKEEAVFNVVEPVSGNVCIYRLSGYDNGRSTDLLVCLQTPRFGLQCLCDAIQHTCHFQKKITDVELAEAVQSISSLPDVEMTVNFGDCSSLFGMLPWQGRCAEFLDFPSHWHLKKPDFTRLLVRFGQIKQRWGR